MPDFTTIPDPVEDAELPSSPVSGAIPDPVEDISPTGGDVSVPYANEYVEKFGHEGKISQGLDYLANALRTAMKESSKVHAKSGDFIDELGAFVSGGVGGLKKERYTSMRDLLDTMGQDPNRLLPDALYKEYGKQGEGIQLGDFLDVPRDLFLGAALDPLALPTGAVIGTLGRGLSTASQAGGKALTGLSKATKPVKVALEGKDYVAQIPRLGSSAPIARGLGETLSRVTPGVGNIAVTGGLLGGAMADSDATAPEILGNIAKGMIAGKAIGLAGGPVGKYAKSAADWLADWGAATLKGPAYAGMSATKETAKGGLRKIKQAQSEILGIYAGHMDGIKPDAQLSAAKVAEGLKTELIRRREMARSIVGEEVASRPGWLNETTEQIAKEMHDDGTIAAALDGQARSTVEAYDALKAANKDVVEKINKEIYDIPLGQWDKETGRGIAGIPFHVEDLRPLESLVDVDKALAARGPLNMARSTERGTSRADLGLKASRELYSRNMAMNWASKEERKAMKMVADYMNAPAATPGLKAWDDFLKFSDKITNFSKWNMLFPSTSWIRNNYPDNITKAFHQNGILGALDAATLGAFRGGLADDMRAITKGDWERPLKNKHSKDMIKYGVLDSNVYKEIDASDDMAKYFMTPEKRAEALALEKSKNPLAKAMAKAVMLPVAPFKFFGNKIISPIGTRIENSAKATTYIRAVETLSKDKALVSELGQEGIKKLAAKVVKDTFFDYSDVTEFERMFAKRMVPFWTFYTRNAKYYAKGFEDPRFVGRVAAASRARDIVGVPLTAEERESIPPYQLAGDASKVGSSPFGIKTIFSPSDSFLDAYKMLNPSLDNLLVEKGHPIAKGLIELATGEDTFTKQPMFPSELPDNRKYLFGGGHANVAAKKISEALLPPGALRNLTQFATGSYGVDVDERGNPIQTTDIGLFGDKLSPYSPNSIFWPKPILRQTYGAIGKGAQGRLTTPEILNNFLNTMQYSTVPLKELREDEFGVYTNASEEYKKRERRRDYREKQSREHRIKP